MKEASPPHPKPSPWKPGAIYKEIMTGAAALTREGLPCPPNLFFQQLATYAEAQAIDDIACAIESDEDHYALAALERVRSRFYWHRYGIELVARAAGDPILTQLALYLLVGGTDGYNHLDYQINWGREGADPEWGTIWAMHQPFRDFTPAFIFKVCLKGDCRFLAVECHAPTRRLPEHWLAKLKARTTIVTGVPVIAFSPSEVEERPHECADEIANALSTLAEELVALHGNGEQPRLDFRPKA
jgi:hypothetical protein